MTGRSEVDFDLLADYAGGALDGTPEADRVASLISSDDGWRQQYDLLADALGAVEADLRGIAGASPMPDDIAARFDDLLASPQLAPSAAARRPAVGERTLARHPAGDTAARRRASWRRWAAPISIAAGVLAFAGLAVPSMLSGTAGSTHQDAPAAAPEMSQQDARALVPTGGAPHVTFSGTDYTRDMLRSNGERATADSSSQSALLYAQGSTELESLAKGPALDSCLTQIRKVLPGTVTALDFAYFEGTPALIASIQAQDGRWALAAGVNCGTQGADELYRTRAG